jgi:hypothetical protein
MGPALVAEEPLDPASMPDPDIPMVPVGVEDADQEVESGTVDGLGGSLDAGQDCDALQY